ncbi:unnamed protein product, partial [Allacma fusca]
CHRIQKFLVHLLQLNLCWRIGIELLDVIHTLRTADATFVFYMDTGSRLLIALNSSAQLFFNWRRVGTIENYGHQLQETLCFQRSVSNKPMIFFGYVAFILVEIYSILWWFFATMQTRFLDFLEAFKNSTKFFSLYCFPKWVSNYSSAVTACSVYAMITELNYTIYIFILETNIFASPVFGYLYTKEFMACLTHATRLTHKEFYKLYEDFKRLQHSKNQFNMVYNFIFVLTNVSWTSLHMRGMIDSMGLTGQNVDTVTRIAMSFFILQIILFYRMSAKACILCRQMRKILSGKLLLELPEFQLRVILNDISFGIHGTNLGRFVSLTPDSVGMVINFSTFISREQ